MQAEEKNDDVIHVPNMRFSEVISNGPFYQKSESPNNEGINISQVAHDISNQTIALNKINHHLMVIKYCFIVVIVAPVMAAIFNFMLGIGD